MSPTRIRLTFTKGEPVRYIGHLDLHRALERIFRRARLPILYSQGYNPRARIILASALPLGVTGRAELAEAWLDGEIKLAEVHAALNESAPPGIDVTRIDRVPEGTPKLPNLVRSALYRVELELGLKPSQDSAQNLLEAEVIQRTRKGKTYDLRPLLEKLTLESGPESEALRLQLAARPGATGRVDEVLLALGILPEQGRAERTELILTEQS